MSEPTPPLLRKLTLLIPGLTGGGAEKVMVRMAEHWAAQGVEVTLITLAGPEWDVYQLPATLRRIALNQQAHSGNPLQGILNNVSRVRAVRRAIAASEPQAVISFTDQMNVLTLLATRRRKFPVLVSERIDTRYQPLSRLWSALRRYTYPTANGVIVQTEASAKHVRQFSGRCPVTVIANGVDPPAVELMPMHERRPVIVAAGRLVEQKGFDLLVTAFASLADRHPRWKLEIYGTGPLEASLQQQISDVGLTERIGLPGFTHELPMVLATSAIFALSSRYEGFPNALLDAMACGAACISFACPSGPEEIIRSNHDGLLVPPGDTQALAAALERAMTELELRTQLGEQAREVVERFRFDEYFIKWESIINEFIQSNSRIGIH